MLFLCLPKVRVVSRDCFEVKSLESIDGEVALVAKPIVTAANPKFCTGMGDTLRGLAMVLYREKSGLPR